MNQNGGRVVREAGLPLIGWPACLKVNMSPRLKVSDFVVQRLAAVEEGSAGFLLGTHCDSSVYVLGLVRQPKSTLEEKSSDSINLCNYDIVSNLPANINFCGVFNVLKNGATDSVIINSLCKKIEKNPVVISFNSASKELTSYIYEEGALEKTDYVTLKENELEKLFVYLRVTATIPLSCDFQKESVEEAFNFFQQKITEGSAAFQILNNDVYILGDKSNDINGISSDVKVSTLNINKSPNGINVVNLGLYLKSTNNDKSPQLAPLIKYFKKVYKHAGIQLSLDSLAIVPYQLKINQLYPILVESIKRNLALNKQSLLSQLKTSESRNASLPETFHFYPPNCGHFLSAAYPAKLTSEQLKRSRETLHLLLSLPMDKPLFRRGNAYDFSESKEKHVSNLILNPHEGLPGSGIPEGEPCLVQGTYAYHHYMQDKCDDNGWGCAYRSLQTIFSWFRFQGYTNMPVPSHKEIQKCLVDIGDKPSSFVGSKQWIGSTEVSFVLDTLLGVTCRIVNVSSGEEMSMKGGELSYHFKTQGTPVMIGGGVLAHTILGVDYNKKTGAIKFLILDPHYTGDEDLKIIQSKGWCGWKGLEFWKKDAFYNMCLPLRPKCV